MRLLQEVDMPLNKDYQTERWPSYVDCCKSSFLSSDVPVLNLKTEKKKNSPPPQKKIQFRTKENCLFKYLWEVFDSQNVCVCVCVRGGAHVRLAVWVIY